jgi:rhodanese-related sulfurtransferase
LLGHTPRPLLDTPRMSEFILFLSHNALLSAGLIGTLLAWIFWEVKQLRRGFVALSPAQLVEWMNRQDARVIDLAENNDFLKSHIDGAVNIALGDFSATHKAIKSALERPIVVYDRAGLRADQAAAQLVKAGFKQVALLDGGLDAWTRESLPTAKGR